MFVCVLGKLNDIASSNIYAWYFSIKYCFKLFILIVLYRISLNVHNLQLKNYNIVIISCFFVKGVCKCDEDFTGTTCNRDKNKVPKLFEVINKGIDFI